MSNSKENYKGFINMSTMKWLKTQVWAWILFGIFIMSIFFYIAKGMIVFIGGTFLGLYLYNKFEINNPSNQIGPPNPTKPYNILDTTVNLMKNGINMMKATNIIGNQTSNYSPVKENFNNFTKRYFPNR
jgi:hypothetical protein